MQEMKSINLTNPDYSPVLLFKDQSIPSSSYSNFDQIRKRGKLCDVILTTCDGEKFSAHKIVLAASIPYFNAMFLSEMAESSRYEILISTVDSLSLQSFIEYAYTGEIAIFPDNVQSMLICANFLQIPNVVDVCCRYIEERVSEQNVLELRQFARTLSFGNLVSLCDKYIKDNFEVVSSTESFLNLDIEDLCILLSSDDICVRNEECIFDCVLKWIQYSSNSTHSNSDNCQLEDGLKNACNIRIANSRAQHLFRLVKLVRLSYISPEYLSEISKHEIIRLDIDTRDVLDEARDILILPHIAITKPCSFNLKPRHRHDMLNIIYAIGGLTSLGDIHGFVEAYHPTLGRWELKDDMPTKRSRIDVAVLNGCLYAIGGFDGSNRLDSVEMYDPRTKKWYRKRSMIYGRSAIAACSMNGQIYACGGYDGNVSLKLCESYQPQLDIWTIIPSMLEPRSAGVVVALDDGRMFAIGGHNGRLIHSSVECYDTRIVSNCQRNTPARSLSSLPIAERVNQLGDFNQGIWYQVAPMIQRRCRHGATSLNNRIFVAGGYDGSTFLNSVEMFDPNVTTTNLNVSKQNSEDFIDSHIEPLLASVRELAHPPYFGQKSILIGQWTRVSSMLSPRSRVGLATSLGRIYAVGGYDGFMNLSTMEVFEPPADLQYPRTRVGLEIANRNSASIEANTSTSKIQNAFISEPVSEESKKNIQPDDPLGFTKWCWTSAPSMISHKGGVGLGAIPVDSHSVKTESPKRSPKLIEQPKSTSYSAVKSPLPINLKYGTSSSFFQQLRMEHLTNNSLDHSMLGPTYSNDLIDSLVSPLSSMETRPIGPSIQRGLAELSAPISEDIDLNQSMRINANIEEKFPSDDNHNIY